MSSQARQRKMAERIKEIVAAAVELRIKDPRLGFVTITDVRVTPDLREASVFYTVYGDDAARAGSAAALEAATGMLRSEVGRQTGVKFTPSLAFIPDAVPENAAHVEDLLRQAAAADAIVHERAANARFAGDPDPYRKPAPSQDASQDAGQDDIEDVTAAPQAPVGEPDPAD